MKKISLCLLVCLLFFQNSSSASSFKNIVKEKDEKEKEAGVADLAKKYSQIVKDAETKRGLFVTHFTKKNKLYLELSDSCLAHTFLLSNRISSTSDTQDFVAGQMVSKPLVIKFSRDSLNVYMHKVQTMDEVDPASSIASSFDKNFFNPILKGFPIEAKNNTSVVIDVSSFFRENETVISPLKPDNPLEKLFGEGKRIKGTFVSNSSLIQEVKTFEKNIEIRSMLSFNTKPLNQPYTVIATRSIVQLPDTLLPIRLQDNRVGYFSTDKKLYTTDQESIHSYSVIHRWRLAPSQEDRAAYFRGELVEPEKPIVFYVDSAFPEKWASAIKQGIEDWNRAFEPAGFKNAIVAKDYPTDDPSFDPDDMRYSCVKYATTATANAMGPSYVDPRTGEILTADVIWHHKITSLLHDWRFTQTAAVDKRVRSLTFDDEVIQESIRYVAAHEIGHTLGLMHNMGASFAFPVDSLRSPSFTQKFGTTPSIMDYARNNFVAQPGDCEKGVRLTPPILGVYDIYAINWGYRLIPGKKTAKEEKIILSSWIKEKEADPSYIFGAQQFFETIDPTDQTEDLGDDHIKAGDLAIKNLKIIMENLENWSLKEGDLLDNVEKRYNALVNQYTRHLRHVLPYVGGMEFKEIRQKENSSERARTAVAKDKQKKAVKWLMNELRTYNSWLTPIDLIQKFDGDLNKNKKIQTDVINWLFNPGVLYRISEGEAANPKDNYKLTDYLNDLMAEVFEATYKKKALTIDDINIQSAAITALIKWSGAPSKSNKKTFAINDSEFVNSEELFLPCNHFVSGYESHKHSFLRINFGTPTLQPELLKPVSLALLKEIRNLYKKAKKTDFVSKSFYEYQILTIETVLKK